MSGDFSRHTFDARRHFNAVHMQQGRVALDSDWNEQVAIADRRRRAEMVDTLGRLALPRETPDGFRIRLASLPGGGRTLSIGRGRLYVDGLLAENHGAAPFAFDRGVERPDGRGTIGVLAEPMGSGPVDYFAQPHWPAPDALPTTPGPHLVYLDVWEREVTHIEQPDLLEKALGGVDTTTRTEIVWQVRVLANVGAGATCATPLDALPGWTSLTRASAGRLTTELNPASLPSDPCLVPTAGGYRGLENQLYRIEIHHGGAPGTATFKWSRDNGTVATTVEEVVTPSIVAVASIGRDSILGFAAGQWIELTDDRREFARQPGAMLKIASVDDENRRITFASPVPADLLPTGVGADKLAIRRTRIRRWDQSGVVRNAAGTMVTDLDAAGSSGTIAVPAGGIRIELEQGIRIGFDLAAAGGVFRHGDSWGFAARSIDASIEVLTAAPPRGLHHHYAPLALVTFPDGVRDQRRAFAPLAGAISVCDVLRPDIDGRLRPLVPAAEIPVDLLSSGLGVLLKQTLDSDTVNGGSVYVTAEIPYHLQPPYAGAGAGAIVGYQPIVLPADVESEAPGMVVWRPFGQTVSFLSNILQQEVPRIGNATFDNEFDVINLDKRPSSWAIAPGNVVVQTNATAGTRASTVATPPAPTMAIHRHKLRDGPMLIDLTVDTPLNGSVGLVYNYLAPTDFCLFIASEVFVPVGFSGAIASLVLSHIQIKGGALVQAASRDITMVSGLSDPRRILLAVKTTRDRLQFGYRAEYSSSNASSVALDFPVLGPLIPGSRVGVMTIGTGTARFSRLAISYADERTMNLIPAGLASRLLGRLVVKRQLLSEVQPPGIVAPRVPEADFETWFWLTPPAGAYYGYRSGTASPFLGIGAGLLIAAGANL
ncbi:hypothetical protein Sa4125_22940 [Aureimonas sp. SA4125]|uniref:DUF6519 domain-containing protein n=1 Tax=Aureimonas sp. SA4125 TaxID=2826993 RepID=UPI001CC7750E|nr:DUF6519 domain-containing protein [Aureimonas sp. SA4125]BDA84752.1 hypothetical protein Sa4125_22940 [Aureimonas sp. SA4125]